MWIFRSVLLLGALLLGCISCSPQSAPPLAPSPKADKAGPLLPRWLVKKIETYEAEPRAFVPRDIWLIQHKGEPAFFVQSGCCDRSNPLLSIAGEELCSPSGGFIGGGDGKCPAPADPGTPVTFVWAHPETPPQRDFAPQLHCVSCSAPDNVPLSTLPPWLAAKIEQGRYLPIMNSKYKQVWQIQHKGEPAYFGMTGRLYDELLTMSGELLCKPRGGDNALGDGKCPWPADPGTEPTFVWVHPEARSKGAPAPRLSNQSLFRRK